MGTHKKGIATPSATTGDKVQKYKWAEVHKHNKQEDCWLVIKGKIYDVSAFISKHPGGLQILQGAGRESTGMFMSYHPLRTEAMLKKFEIGHVEDYNPYYQWDSAFYTTLKTRVEKHLQSRGISGFDSPMVYLKTASIVTLWLILYNYAMIQGWVLAALLLGIVHSQIGIGVAHDGGHGSYSKNPIANRLAALAMDFMGGSSVVWAHQHNIGHHPYTNREGGYYNEDYDPDAVSAYPILRTHPNQPWKPIHAYQHIYLWFLIGFSGLKWAYGDIKWLIRGRYNDIQFHKLTVWDYALVAIMKTIFVTYTFIIPFSLHSFPRALLNVGIFVLTNGNLFILNFAVNHLLEENTFPDRNTEERDWAKLQVTSSTNYATDSAFFTWFSGGLNHQIEHHLFPYVTHGYSHEIQPIVEQTCKEFNVNYINKPTYWEALAGYYHFMKKMSKPVKSQ